MLMFQPLMKYAEFSGRARRAEYWLFSLFISLVYMALIITLTVSGAAAVAASNSGSPPESNPVGAIALIVFCIFALAMFIPSLAVSFRRLHDIDKGAAWILAYLVPIVGPLIILVMCLLDGTPGPNKYGQDPKGRPPVPTYTAMAPGAV
jgi:uncharacterized membrane protein YhaH (DUF805 family)